MVFSLSFSFSFFTKRYVPSSQRDSQTAALRRLAQIESRFRSRMQPQEQARQTVAKLPASHLTSELGMLSPPEAVSQSLEASPPAAAHSSSDHSLKGKRFLKNKATAAAASGSPKGPDDDVMSRSRTAGAAVPLVGLENKLMRPVRSVSLESDEEDMRKLLGESLDSTDKSFLRPDNISSMKEQDKVPEPDLKPFLCSLLVVIIVFSLKQHVLERHCLVYC